MSIDYRSFNNNGESTSHAALNRRWWKAPNEDRAGAVTAIIQFLANNDLLRARQYYISSKLYGNDSLTGTGLSYSKFSVSVPAQKERISYNVIQSSVDTLVSKMAKNKPKPLFLTSGGDYKLQRKAKKLDKFVEGIFYANDGYSLGNKILKDSCIWGDGIVHVFNHYDKVQWERVFPSELFVDPVEALHGNPRQMHRLKIVDREVLIDLFPTKRQLILEASSASADLTGFYQNVSDQIAVVESWHLPSGPEANDGVHMIAIPNGMLFGEDWNKHFFPFARLPWCERQIGYWSQSAAEQLKPIQLEINKILWIIQRSFHLAGSFKVLIENGAKIVKEHLNSEIGTIVNYTGTPPQYIVPPVIPAEYYQHLINLKNSAYEQIGVSQLSAASQKPAGLNSGAALREYKDNETDRFTAFGQAYEKFFLDLSRLSVSCGRDIYSLTKKFSVVVPGKKFIETIDWKEINLEDDEFFMKIFPISSLPSDPAGRLQTIQEYIQAGFITPRIGRRLLDFPDLEMIEDLQNSTEDYLHDILEKLVDEDEYTPPEPEDDLSLAKELALLYYAQGKCNNLEPEKLEKLRTFMTQVDLLIKKSMLPQAGAPQAGAQPQAQPMPQAQSDLIQNVPGML